MCIAYFFWNSILNFAMIIIGVHLCEIKIIYFL